MKINELIIGNWYKSKLGNYFKFKEFKNDYFYSSEYIYSNKWKEGMGGLAWLRGFGLEELVGVFEADLLEIQKFLPENHSDLIVKSNTINEDLTYLIDLFDELNIK